MRFSLLLADADNTLFNFHAAERAAFSAVVSRYGLPESEEIFQTYRRINHKHWQMLNGGQTTSARLRVARFADFADTIGLRDIDVQQMSDTFVGALCEQGMLVNGAEAFVRRMAEHMPVCVVTNGFAVVQKSRFEHSPLLPYLQEIYISENFPHAKPDPGMIQAALHRFGIADPAQAVMIGDSEESDIAAAVNAGTQSILFTGGCAAPAQTRATFTAQTLEQAADWILAEQ